MMTRALLFASLIAPLSLAFGEPRTLRIDPRDPASLPTLQAAVALARPGDTLWLAPGSGPYREELYITVSGTADAPITIEGNGNEVTGFDVLAFSPQGVAVAPVKYPFVLRHRGVRVREDAATQRFTDADGKEPVAWDSEAQTLTLAPGVSADGWEISTRLYVVRILDVSHHIYRDLVASGALNDGFNLHGRGVGLVFENITGRDNLDEGYSAHGDIESEIRGGRFFGNDNGIFNIDRSRSLLVDVDISHNLGRGFGLAHEATADATRLRVWGSGLAQIFLSGTPAITGQDITVYRNAHAVRPWITYKESRKQQTPGTRAGNASSLVSELVANRIVTLDESTAPVAP